MPEAAPVTTATFPDNSPRSMICTLSQGADDTSVRSSEGGARLATATALSLIETSQHGVTGRGECRIFGATWTIRWCVPY